MTFLNSRGRKPWTAHCELKHWNLGGWRWSRFGPPLIYGLCAIFAFNHRLYAFFRPLLTPVSPAPVFATFSVHGLHSTVYAPSINPRDSNAHDEKNVFPLIVQEFPLAPGTPLSLENGKRKTTGESAQISKAIFLILEVILVPAQADPQKGDSQVESWKRGTFSESGVVSLENK